MQLLLYVAIGGAIGSVMRYILTQNITSNATFWINILGSLLLGAFVFIIRKKLSNSYANQISALITYGFCGGFTTFSTFNLENFKLINEGQLYSALFNIVVSVSISILSIWFFYWLSKKL